MSPRHYIDDALLRAAREFGATAIFDGMGGEISVTASQSPQTVWNSLRAVKRWAVEVRDHLRRKNTASQSSFLVPPSPQLLASLPRGFGATSDSRMPRFRFPRAGKPIGLIPGYEKAWRSPTSVRGGGMRQYSPLRDRDLVYMVAGMSADYTRWQGQDRALARALLNGHVPDHVTQQPKGLGYSVDYDHRFQTEISQILERLEAWRQAGVDMWLDLDWLEREVRHLMAMKAIPADAQFRVQLTAIAAEYFLYCHDNGIGSG